MLDMINKVMNKFRGESRFETISIDHYDLSVGVVVGSHAKEYDK